MQTASELLGIPLEAIKQHDARLKKGTEEDVFRALAWAKKKEEEFQARIGGAGKSEEDFWGDSPSSAPTSGGGANSSGRRGNSTLESMRASRNNDVQAPF